MEKEIQNKVASSQLITFDLETLYDESERVVLDVKDRLFEGLVLREKDFRDYIKGTDWSAFEGKSVAITCSADAIVPTWAYMLLASALEPYAAMVHFGTLDDLEIALFNRALSKVDWSSYEGAKVVIKGCSKVAVPVAAYVEVTFRLRSLASSIMYGEPCSTVPIFKRRPQVKE